MGYNFKMQPSDLELAVSVHKCYASYCINALAKHAEAFCLSVALNRIMPVMKLVQYT